MSVLQTAVFLESARVKHARRVAQAKNAGAMGAEEAVGAVIVEKNARVGVVQQCRKGNVLLIANVILERCVIVEIA